MTQHTNCHVEECIHVSGAGKENPAFSIIHPSLCLLPHFPICADMGGGSLGYTLSLLQHPQMRATSIHMHADTGFRARDVESRLTGNLIDVPNPQDP